MAYVITQTVTWQIIDESIGMHLTLKIRKDIIDTTGTVRNMSIRKWDTAALLNGSSKDMMTVSIFLYCRGR